jgi:hypothetical protein
MLAENLDGNWVFPKVGQMERDSVAQKGNQSAQKSPETPNCPLESKNIELQNANALFLYSEK